MLTWDLRRLGGWLDPAWIWAVIFVLIVANLIGELDRRECDVVGRECYIYVPPGRIIECWPKSGE